MVFHLQHQHYTDQIQAWYNLTLFVVFHLQHQHYTDQIQAWYNLTLFVVFHLQHQHYTDQIQAWYNLTLFVVFHLQHQHYMTRFKPDTTWHCSWYSICNINIIWPDSSLIQPDTVRGIPSATSTLYRPDSSLIQPDTVRGIPSATSTLYDQIQAWYNLTLFVVFHLQHQHYMTRFKPDTTWHCSWYSICNINIIWPDSSLIQPDTVRGIPSATSTLYDQIQAWHNLTLFVVFHLQHQHYMTRFKPDTTWHCSWYSICNINIIWPDSSLIQPDTVRGIPSATSTLYDQIQAWHNSVENARQSSLKGWEWAIVNQMKTGTVSMAKLGKLRGGVEHIWALLIIQIPSWNELNRTCLVKQVEKVSIWNQLPVMHFICWCSPWNFWRENITFRPLNKVALRCCSVLNTDWQSSFCMLKLTEYSVTPRRTKSWGT